MKLKKFIERAEMIFDSEAKKRQKRKKNLKKLLKKLSKYEKKLVAKLEKVQNSDTKERLQSKINIIHAQRLKGLQMIKTLKNNADLHAPPDDSLRK